MKKIAELRDLTTEQLQEELISLRKLQFQLRLKRSSDVLPQTHQIKNARLAIARVKTIMTEKVGKSHVTN